MRASSLDLHGGGRAGGSPAGHSQAAAGHRAKRGCVSIVSWICGLRSWGRGGMFCGCCPSSGVSPLSFAPAPQRAPVASVDDGGEAEEDPPTQATLRQAPCELCDELRTAAIAAQYRAELLAGWAGHAILRWGSEKQPEGLKTELRGRYPKLASSPFGGGQELRRGIGHGADHPLPVQHDAGRAGARRRGVGDPCFYSLPVQHDAGRAGGRTQSFEQLMQVPYVGRG